jgi:hypothetical protein
MGKSCSGKHGFGPAPSIIFCRHVYLHSIGTMMGFHAVTLWQNETSHFLSDSLQFTNGKDGSKRHFLESKEEAYYLVEVILFVSFFPRCFGANDDVIW